MGKPPGRGEEGGFSGGWGELIPLGTHPKVNKKLSLVKMSFFEAMKYIKTRLSLLISSFLMVWVWVGGGGG